LSCNEASTPDDEDMNLEKQQVHRCDQDEDRLTVLVKVVLCSLVAVQLQRLVRRVLFGGRAHVGIDVVSLGGLAHVDVWVLSVWASQ